MAAQAAPAASLYRAAPIPNPAPLELSEDDTCTILRLLIESSPSENVLNRFPAEVAGDADDAKLLLSLEADDSHPVGPALPNELLLKLFARAGAHIVVDGRMIPNGPILHRARQFLISQATHVATGHFASVYRFHIRNGFPGRDPAKEDVRDVVVRLFHNADRLLQIHTAISMATPGFDKPLEALLSKPYPVQRGYAMRLGATGEYELSWVDNWIFLAMRGVLHLDLKPDAIYRSSFIDYDNVILQLAGRREWVASDAEWYGPFNPSGLQGDMTQLLQLVGSKSGFFLSGNLLNQWVIALHPVSLERIAAVNNNPIDESRWADHFEEVRTRRFSLCEFRFRKAKFSPGPGDDPNDPTPFKLPFKLDPAATQVRESDAIWAAMNQQ